MFVVEWFLRYVDGMKIYTKTGDKGETALYGGERVAKDSLRVAAYGTVDEANSAIGMARSHLSDEAMDKDLAHLQNALFDVGADLATPNESKYRKNVSPIDEQDISYLEQLIDHYDNTPLTNFILPGGHPSSAALHLARTIARRAEREVTTLKRQEAINEHVAVFLNRLSDLLFVMARAVNARAGINEVKWHVKGRSRDYSPIGRSPISRKD
jgi:cob(I)alamin adenosyltransferase